MIKRAEIIAMFSETVAAHLPGLKPTVRLSGQSPVMLGTTWSDAEIVLTYAPHFLRVCTTPELLRVALLHEVCHPLSAPSAKVTIPTYASVAARECCVAYLDLFREFIAHQEFLKRFPSEATLFAEWELRTLQPRTLTVRTPIVGQDGFFLYLGKLFLVFYNAIFLELVQNPFFASWCSSRRKSATYQLFRYIMEDVAHIAGRVVEYQAKLDLMVDSFKLVMNVAVDELEADRLALLAPVGERAGELGLDEEIAALWARRDIATRGG